jgi:3-oxoacyl-[acyl-carrier-protein] synthase II
MASDAFHLTAPHDQGRGCAEALRLALADAGLGPEDVDYVNAHGTGTVLNDLSEVRALKHALGEHAHRVPVSSTKTSTGHLIGAAGVVETAATVEALNRRTAPPTLSLEVPDPELDLDFVAAGPRPLEVPLDRPAVALKCSAGFGGHNVVLCLEGAA